MGRGDDIFWCRYQPSIMASENPFSVISSWSTRVSIDWDVCIQKKNKQIYNAFFSPVV